MSTFTGKGTSVLRSRRTVRLLAVLAAAVLGLGIVIGVARSSHTGPAPVARVVVHADGGVPWVDDVASRRTGLDAPTCRAAQLLELRAPHEGAGLGTRHETFDLINHGPACTLGHGDATLGRAGRTISTLELPDYGGRRRGPDFRVPIDHGGRITLDASILDGCVGGGPDPSPNPHPRLLPVDLVLGDQIIGSSRPQPAATCGEHWGLTIQHVVGVQGLGTGPYSSLHVTVAPRPARVDGSRIDYQVMIANKGRRPFTFRDCPSYTEKVGADVPETGYLPTTHSRYRLDCAGIGIIPPGVTRVLDMEAQLPDTALSFDRVAIGWSMDDGPHASDRLRIRR